MRKLQFSNMGNIALLVLILLNPLLWFLFPPMPSAQGLPNVGQRMLAEICSTTAMALMTCSIVLSLRLRFIEPFFGGLDQMYKTHKTAGVLAVVMLIIHYALVLPFKSSSFGLQLGVIAFSGILLLVFLTLAPRIPTLGGYFQLGYHQWKWTHKLIGLFFIIGNLHATNVNTLLIDAPVPGWYWKIMTNIGMLAYLYRELVQPWLQRPHHYKVAAANALNPSTLELTLAHDGRKLSHRAGQFAFICLPSTQGLAESHPFTISSAPHEPNLRFSIKACGDWTKQLHKTAKVGMTVKVEGPYGHMNYKHVNSGQIWIAGGIGITPFLSWVRDFGATLDRDIYFFYTVRAEADALFWGEFAQSAAQHPRFHAVLNVSSTGGSLTIDKIQAHCGDVRDKHVYLCGPLAMTMGFVSKFKALGVPADQIHFEEFNFR